MPGVSAFDPQAFENQRGGADVVTAPPGFAPAFGIPMAFSGGPGSFDDAPRAQGTAPIDDVARAPVAPVTNRWERTEVATAAPAAAAAPQAEPAAAPEPPPIPELPERAPKVRPKPVAATPAPAATASAASQSAPSSAPAQSPAFTLINGPGASSPPEQSAPAEEPQPAAVPAAEPEAPAAADEPVEVAEAAEAAPTPASETGEVVAGAPGFAPPAAANEAIETLAATKSADAPAPPAPSSQVAGPSSPSLVPLGRSGGPDVMTVGAAAATAFALAGLAVFGFRRWRGASDVEAASPVARDFGAISLETPAAGDGDPEVSEASDDLSIPSNYTQALHVLGASADASTDAIKKIVDGLRKSWHPDHARSESDRIYREKRARQINVAWDIVSQRRAVA
jgi:hypothetical protein